MFNALICCIDGRERSGSASTTTDASVSMNDGSVPSVGTRTKVVIPACLAVDGKNAVDLVQRAHVLEDERDRHDDERAHAVGAELADHLGGRRAEPRDALRPKLPLEAERVFGSVASSAGWR